MKDDREGKEGKKGKEKKDKKTHPHSQQLQAGMIKKTFSVFGSSRSPRAMRQLKKTAKSAESEASKSMMAMQMKIPTPEPLTEMLRKIVYVKPFSEVNKDILRLIKRVSVIHRVRGQEEVPMFPAEQERPKDVVGNPNENVYIVMQLMQHLLEFFETPDVAEDLIGKMTKLYEDWMDQQKAEKEENDEEGTAEGEGEKKEGEKVDVDFSVPELIRIIGGDKTRTAYAVRCIHQSVAISGHMHIKSKVCSYMTKDVRGDAGWQVIITLAEDGFVQVKHTRRESSVESPHQARNHWEVQFDVHMTFDKNMNEITASKLTITDLELSETMDNELAKYLKEKFNNGNLVVC